MLARSPFKVGLVQMAMSPQPEANLNLACAKIREAAAQGAQVLCLPELFRSPYFCQTEDAANFALAERIPGPSTEAIGAVARQAGVIVIATLFERRAPGLYHNTAAVIGANGELLGLYRKMHIPDDPGYYEKFYFTPGDLGFCAFETFLGRLGILICWDQWYPEAARLIAMAGADIIFYPTAIGWHPQEKAANGAAQRDAWRTVQRGHAIANGLYVAAVNRVGQETPAGPPGLEFWGGSFLADPFGVVLAEASVDHEETLIATVDPARIEEVRQGWPFLRDRRIDAYAGIERRFLDTRKP
ncbi:MAG TPA: carbon-nitrogen hydrolase [Polyangia bacterium]|nr:carbon-nitrogen hydrolase [Polyangia bacterium]